MLRQWKDYWNSYSGNHISKIINVWVLVTLLLILVIGLTGLSIKTGNYVKVLESNIVSIKSELDECTKIKTETNYDLDTCSLNLQDKINSLNSCQNQQNILSDKLSECNKNLDSCENNYDNLRMDYDNIKNKYDDCADDLNKAINERNSQQNRADSLQQNYINDYVRDWCCFKFKNTNTSKTYYSLVNNDITCYNTSIPNLTNEFSC